MRILRRIGWIGLWLGVPLLVHAKTVTYTVKKGDTLTSIAQKHHLSLKKLRRLNHLRNNTIRIGQRLVVKQIAAKHKQRSKKLAKALRRHTVAANGIRFKKAKRQSSISDIVFGNTLRYDVESLSPKSQRIIALAKQKLGRRYVWGAAGRHNTFDCSGLTSYVCRQVGIKLPRRAIQQSRVGKYVTRSQLKPGDLVFFDTSRRRRGYVNHVGIYIGNGKFIHASSAKKRVIITSLDKPFYKQRFKWGRRVISSL